MGEVLSYSITSGVLLLTMFLAFRLTLSSEKQHGYNRGIMLLMYLVAFTALPAAQFIRGLSATAPVAEASFATVVTAEEATTTAAKPIWGTVLIWMYLTGLLVVTLKTILTWRNIIWLVSCGEKIKKDGYTLVLTDNERVAPFSWIRYVVMSRKDYATCGDAILIHEKRHIALYHWVDLLIAQAVVIINWFNPAAWLAREELMLIHEYQADMAVVQSGNDAKDYQ